MTPQVPDRQYRVHFVHNDGRHEVLSPKPMTHGEACTMLSKTMPATARDCILVEAEPHPCVGHDPSKQIVRGVCAECIWEIEEAAAETMRRNAVARKESRRSTRVD